MAPYCTHLCTDYAENLDLVLLGFKEPALTFSLTKALSSQLLQMKWG